MRKAVFISIAVLVVFVIGYVYFTYYYPYSDGRRDGILQKFSRKGNLFKTYEGEIILLGFGKQGPAYSAQYFYFSVNDEKIADSLERCGGKLVTLHYIQYHGVLPWRGENYNKVNQEKGQYIVDRIDEVKAINY
ncbi:MAG: hypothetical protein JST82_05755 [Bacteroidetes bacterium]|nr:hypothetical protein [Bacteroidota bacterium]